MTKPLALRRLGLPLSEKQIPQVVENLKSGGKPKEALERVAMRPRQVRYQAALRPDIAYLILNQYSPAMRASVRPPSSLA